MVALCDSEEVDVNAIVHGTQNSWLNRGISQQTPREQLMRHAAVASPLDQSVRPMQEA